MKFSIKCLCKAQYNNDTNEQGEKKESSVDNGEQVCPIIMSLALQSGLLQLIHQRLQYLIGVWRGVTLKQQGFHSLEINE